MVAVQHAHFAARAQYVGQEDRTFHILLGEQALNTHFGGPEVMRGQLRRLLDAMDLPGLSLGIIPARAPPRSLS
ncbi:Scr1 family TA system antitoxin-like transcriptional regulator [Streptomyces sp. P1-3]|uniref:Scr1 family TA system antitoxin-like transcriptional regulator n=1 Tax=Streptomyces sp. P1-3 TaxID=3421658 RepID=UPI003D3611C0